MTENSDTLKIESSISSLVDGFVTFVHVNPETSPSPHYLSLEPVTEEEKELYETARALRSR
jgi:hypothetical protein